MPTPLPRPTDLAISGVPIEWPPERLSRLTAALEALGEAHGDARELGLDPWELALTLPELGDTGAELRDLRWLVTHRLVEHLAEVDSDDPERRAFEHVPGRAVGHRSCFVVTPGGLFFADRIVARHAAAPPGTQAGERPRWDPDARVLSRGGEVVKRFRTPARSQELVLAAFEESGWPSRIDDPLPRLAGEDPRQRLHDAIRRLNGNQLSARRLRFHGDGTGEGISWSA
ncbi:Uncharacterized protein OS=Rhodopirellula maiorica SM1 GN=RMSM_05735 PE=4 SV=1 [Gemmataceae bacterium]|jgi:hypothetical protein|nr:Uncharacterized protein OS=Rhodopirellula maiorica SM1 GN=RMSM_05735 PE=4 SV=1 [Gemmataceae bacterium]VTT96505.1 Uncharacterized protein OS=Rhodopirellula maiorica SM1 GN=RMSM_05735 PE=4 SV=1 [Gemmataceae bacterium]